MEMVTFENDIPTICVAAQSFPDGAMEAHQTLHGKLPSKEGRQFFAVSYGNPQGGIAYLAAATELHNGEAEQLGCETFLIKKGSYAGVTIQDYWKDMPEIGATFQKLLTLPDIDPNGYCLEIYLNKGKDVQCLIKLK
jgi:hypothetical protein